MTSSATFTRRLLKVKVFRSNIRENDASDILQSRCVLRSVRSIMALRHYPRGITFQNICHHYMVFLYTYIYIYIYLFFNREVFFRYLLYDSLSACGWCFTEPVLTDQKILRENSIVASGRMDFSTMLIHQ